MLNSQKKKTMLECPYCNEYRKTAKGLYYHLRIDHQTEKEIAFSLVGVSLDLLKEAQQNKDY